MTKQESWQRQIYEQRKAAYESEPLPTAAGMQSLLLTYREHCRMLARLRIRSSDNVLDIGCSSGQFCNLIRQRYGAKTVGMDISVAAAAAAVKRNPASHFVVGSADRPLGFRGDVFDKVIAFDVIEHLENPTQAIREIRRILKPGGRVLLHIPVSDIRGSMDSVHRRIKPADWSERVREAGHDYSIMLSRMGYEQVLVSEGFRILFSRRYNSMLQNIFDYHMTHRLLNRLFYLWKAPFWIYHRLLAPMIETAVSFDRILQMANVGASVYVIAE